MSETLITKAVSELGFKSLGRGIDQKGHYVILAHPDFGCWTAGSGDDFASAHERAAEKAYSRYWSSRLASNDALRKAGAVA